LRRKSFPGPTLALPLCRRFPSPKARSARERAQKETSRRCYQHPGARTKEVVFLIEESLRWEAQDAKREAHHAVPRCLLRLRDRADEHHDLDGAAIQKWLDYELEALRWGVDPDVSREALAAMVQCSATEFDQGEHREVHAGDFARWGRRGGSTTLRRYGTVWFSLMAKRRWEKISAETLAEAFAAMNGGRP
jgi:hypothetical protein